MGLAPSKEQVLWLEGHPEVEMAWLDVLET